MAGRTVAIIQARMGSTRLPEKVLKEISGKTMLRRVVERTASASTLDDVVVATSNLEGDDRIQMFCEEAGIRSVRGSEQDVLNRYRKAAVSTDAEVVVRITSDCPLIGPATIDRVVSAYHRHEADFVTNTLYYTYPDGLDVEVFPKEVLIEADETAETPNEREHVTPYMRSKGSFNRLNVTNPVNISSYSFTSDHRVLRWTVDYSEDLKFMRAIFDRLTDDGECGVNQVSVLELLQREPSLLEINEDRTHDW